MQTGEQRVYVRYLAAVLLAVVAQLVRLPLHNPTSMPFTTYYPFIVLAAWYGGLWPGVLCTLLCGLESDYFNIEPRFSFWISGPDYWFGIVLFAVTGLAVTVLFEQLRRAHQREQRIRTEEQQMRSHLEAIVNSSDDAMFTRQPDGTITSWNRAAERIYGYTAQEVVGQKISLLWPPEQVATELAVQQRVSVGTVVKNREARHRCKDGREIDALINLTPLVDGDGRAVSVVGTVRDITQLKRVESTNAQQARELANQKAILESIVQHSTTAFALVSGADFVFELANPAYHHLLPGIAIEGRPFAEVWPEAAPEILPGFRKVMVTGQGMQLGAVARPLLHRVDGRLETLWVDVAYVPLRDLREPGSVDILIVANDVGEFKRIEDGLRDNEERMRLLVEHAPAALAMFDTEMRYLQCSHRWRNDYGLGDRDLHGLCHYDVLPEVTEAWKQIHQRGLRGEVVCSEAERFEREDGRVQWIRWEVRPWRNAQGQVGGIVIFSEEISERMKFEQQILRLNEDLEERVKVRTKQLENSSRELESFAYSVSHDLRAPLRGIDGWTQAFLEDYGQTLDAQARRYLERVRAEAQRMGQLIDDLLHLSRVTRLPVVMAELDLSALARSVATRVAESSAGQEIHFNIQPGILVRGDQRLLEIALTNLLDNAVKFSRKKPVSIIEIGTDQHGETMNGQPVIYIRDNGAGFDMAYAGQLFGAFQRLHSSAEFPGTGIGLATVQRVILKHGGSIRAESAPGQGATFYFTLGGEDDIQKNHAPGRG
jgi:PAS domain S-box-containing protein